MCTLALESGRDTWSKQKTPLEIRKCSLYGTGEVEDEKHVMKNVMNEIIQTIYIHDEN